MAEEALTLNSDGLIRDHGILTGLPPECALLDSGGGQETEATSPITPLNRHIGHNCPSARQELHLQG